MDDFQDPSEDLDSEDVEDTESALRCASCDTVISHTHHLFHRDEHGIYANPQGHVFEIVTVSSVENLQTHGQATTEFTWFAGYAWQIVSCGTCRRHLGWCFLAVHSDTQPAVFWGLLRNQLKWS